MAEQPRAYIGIWGLVALLINNIIGSGIFSAPSSIIQNTNSIGLSLVIWLITGLVALTGAFAYAELASIITVNGGDNNYVNFIRW
jgi:amino acid transporter